MRGHGHPATLGNPGRRATGFVPARRQPWVHRRQLYPRCPVTPLPLPPGQYRAGGLTRGTMPSLYIIAGPNGVGKTTFVKRFLPEEVRCLEFVNADLIAQGLSPFAPDGVSLRAGRIMLARLDDLVARRESFCFETTLSGRGYVRFLEKARPAGYRVHLDFLWVPVLDITRGRVVQRVKKGGHNIPDAVQERRFTLGLHNLFHLYRPLLHHWRVFDNSGDHPVCVAEERDGEFLVHVRSCFDSLPEHP